MSYYEIISSILAVLALAVALAAAGSARASVDEARKQAAAAKDQADAARTQADLAHVQLEQIKQRIAMVSDPAQMFEILPAWYIGRMGRDDWGFALLLKSSDVIAISRIDGVSTDGRWMEVTLLEPGQGPSQIGGVTVTYAPTDRLQASIQIATVEAAFEIWTS